MIVGNTFTVSCAYTPYPPYALIAGGAGSDFILGSSGNDMILSALGIGVPQRTGPNQVWQTPAGKTLWIRGSNWDAAAA